MLLLLAHGIGEDDEVIIPSLTFIATALAVIHAKATPVFVDITADTHLIDYTKIEEKITKKTKAIIPVHLYGQPCDMNPINKIAKKYSLLVLEDACQAHGSMYFGKRAGSLGNSAAFSFYPSKNLGAYGDAGAITTSDKTIGEKVRLLRNYGASDKYLHSIVGYNSRLDNLQAAVLSIKLEFLEKQNAKRRTHAAMFKLLLKNEPVELPTEKENVLTNYHLFTIQVKKRDALLQFLIMKQIFCGIHYPRPMHLQPALSYLTYIKGDFPIAENVSANTISLPLYPEMTTQQIYFICKQITAFFKK